MTTYKRKRHAAAMYLYIAYWNINITIMSEKYNNMQWWIIITHNYPKLFFCSLLLKNGSCSLSEIVFFWFLYEFYILFSYPISFHDDDEIWKDGLPISNIYINTHSYTQSVDIWIFLSYETFGSFMIHKFHILFHIWYTIYLLVYKNVHNHSCKKYLCRLLRIVWITMQLFFEKWTMGRGLRKKWF